MDDSAAYLKSTHCTRRGSGGGEVCPGPVSISQGCTPLPPLSARGEVGEFEGKGAMEARKISETLGDLLVGVGRGGAHPSQVRCILMMPLLAHSAQNARKPVLFKYDAESSIGAV